MKTLDIPYIGIKIESIPTILRVLSSSKNDADFIDYYAKLGKSKKTASEYLHSLRNLKLAKKDTTKNTRIMSPGKVLLDDDISLFYHNLLKHCLLRFSDLRVIHKIIMQNQDYSALEVSVSLQTAGYSIKRIQTLSSFLKLFQEAGKVKSKKLFLGTNFDNEPLEYNQLYKVLSRLCGHEDRHEIFNIYEKIAAKYSITTEQFGTYLQILQREEKIQLYAIGSTVDPNRSFILNNTYYYYIQVNR